MIVFSFLRSLGASFIFVLLTLFHSSLLIILSLCEAPRGWMDHVVCVWSESTLKLFGIEVVETGRENIPPGACLFLFNHTSFLDIFVMSARISGMRFGAKIELFKIPIFGRAMRQAGVLPIARQNREKVFKVYENAKARTVHGQKYSLSPEGSRNTQETLLPFKAGPFIFAINSQIPIVPVVIRGAAKAYPKFAVLPNWKNWKTVISIDYLPLVSVEGYEIKTRSELQRKVYEMMSPYFTKNPNP